MALNSEICLLLPLVPGLKACATMPGSLMYLCAPQFYVPRTVHPLQPNNKGPQSLASACAHSALFSLQSFICQAWWSPTLPTPAPGQSLPPSLVYNSGGSVASFSHCTHCVFSLQTLSCISENGCGLRYSQKLIEHSTECYSDL